MREGGCERTVSINFPCDLDEGHVGVCRPDTADSLRIYGVALEDIRRIAQDLHDARMLGIATGDGKRTSFGRYIVLKAALMRRLDICRMRRFNDLYPSDIEDALKQADSDSARWEDSQALLARLEEKPWVST